MADRNLVIHEELNKWYKLGIINEEIYDKLRADYRLEPWNYKLIIRWALVIGAGLLGTGVISFLVMVFKSLSFLTAVLSILTVIFFVCGSLLAWKKMKIYQPKTGGALIVISALFLGASVFSSAELMFPGGDNWPLLLLLISVLYILISYWKRNNVVLVMGLLTLATWFGTESGYVSGWGAYYLGLNYPLRFAAVSPAVILTGYAHKKISILDHFHFTKQYYALGLLYTNLSLWLLSIFGNDNSTVFGNISYHKELFIYSSVWLAADAAFFIIGSRFKNKMFTGFSVVFIILNLYTRYFEYFWNSFDKWVFFIVLGALTVAAGAVTERLRIRKNEPGSF